MRLEEVIKGIKILEACGDLSLEIEGVSSDSRTVRPNYLFVAIKGEKNDGHWFIEEALKKGASALLVERRLEGIKVPYIVVEDTKAALAQVASNFYGHPSKEMRLIGITGTNGKTTTTYLLESVIAKAGFEVGVIGTVNYRWKGIEKEAPNTTPSALYLQQLLGEMKRAGVKYVVMEVSSHALVQRRVKGCHFDVGVFTNLSPEHLDYHKTMEEYLRAKALLFEEVLKESEKETWAIYNADDHKVKEVGERTVWAKRLSFGQRGDIHPLSFEEGKDGVKTLLRTPWGDLQLTSPLIGVFNLYNLMAAVGVSLALGIDREAIREGIADFKGVPGRMEKIGEAPLVIVDYAHTPDALEKVLKELKKLTSGRLIVVFGCGGERDKTKRPLMGRIASTFSSLVILTSDNPRREDPLRIIEEIKEGLIDGTPYLIIPDRREAIREAIKRARKDDTVLIAGKGHEIYQIIGDERIPFDDRIEAKRALEEIIWS
jgi:UDP-N-acetylmuramoyl-L-alanyl-D-glutamate--2,6-diaminopimelate ligase